MMAFYWSVPMGRFHRQTLYKTHEIYFIQICNHTASTGTDSKALELRYDGNFNILSLRRGKIQKLSTFIVVQQKYNLIV